MAFCSNCGTRVQDGDSFCPACGARIIRDTDSQTDQLYQMNNADNSNRTADQNDIEQNKILAILSYISWLVLIPALAAPQSKFARFHANQGIVLLISEVIWTVVSVIIASVFMVISIWLGICVAVILGLASIAFLVLVILGIINAANGEMKELPVIGKFRVLK